MNRHAILSSLFLTCMLSAGAAFSGTDIVKCIDARGHMVLTDQPCLSGNELALAPAPAAVGDGDAAADAAGNDSADNPLPAALAKSVKMQRLAAAPAERRPDPWVKRAASIAPMTRDAMTLKAAKLNLQMLDNASSMLRQQRVAGLN